jgi:hypothetical protein
MGSAGAAVERIRAAVAAQPGSLPCGTTILGGLLDGFRAGGAGLGDWLSTVGSFGPRSPAAYAALPFIVVAAYSVDEHGGTPKKRPPSRWADPSVAASMKGRDSTAVGANPPGSRSACTAPR